MTRDDPPSIRSLTFDPEEGAYVTEFDNRSVPLAVTVVSVIAKITGQSATDLQPLYHVGDSDALSRIIGDHPSDVYSGKRLVEFTYQNHKIQVLSSGVLRVYPLGTQGDEDEKTT
jgi:hypothetical protein